MTVSQDFDINDQKEEFHLKGYIALSDGTKLEFGNWDTGRILQNSTVLKRQVIYSYDYKKPLPQTVNEQLLNQQRYEMARGSKGGFYNDISFVRGESYGSLEFKELKSIEFEGENNRDIIITLKNGNSTNAIIKDTEGTQQGFEGLVGVSKKGAFYIERKNLRIIYYY